MQSHRFAVFQEKLSPESLQEKNRFKKIPAKKFPVQVQIVNLSVISTVCGNLGFHCYVLVTLTENCLSYTHATVQVQILHLSVLFCFL